MNESRRVRLAPAADLPDIRARTTLRKPAQTVSDGAPIKLFGDWGRARPHTPRAASPIVPADQREKAPV
jgi:hypothetical protein